MLECKQTRCAFNLQGECQSPEVVFGVDMPQLRKPWPTLDCDDKDAYDRKLQQSYRTAPHCLTYQFDGCA